MAAPVAAYGEDRLAVHDEWGRIPRQEEIDQVCLRPRVRDQAVAGLPSGGKEQQHTGQLAIF